MRRRTRPVRPIFAALGAILMLLLAGCASMPQRRGPLVPGDFRYLEEYLDWRIGAEMRKAKVAGLSIAIADDRRILWAKGYGRADAAGAPATPDTLYRVGSVSKVLTATEVMRRTERADIELDGALASQLPGFTVRSRFAGVERITVRSLLAHHSGLPSDLMNGMWAAEPLSLAKLQGLLAQESLVTAPQSKYKYSNLDYSLLGRLIEVRSGETFAAAMRRDLLAPLGMARSTFGPAAEAGSGLANGYRAGKQVPSIELRDLPAGSLISSASDLSRFMSFVLAQGRTVGGEQLLQPSTLQEMFTPQFQGLPLDFGHDMGLGWKIWGVQVPGMGPIVWHNGEYPGYYGSMMLAPERKLGVVILANDQSAGTFAMDVGGKALALALEALTGVAATQSGEPGVTPSSFDLPREQLDRFTGDYMVFGQLSRISRNGSNLSLRAMGQNLSLVPIAPETFLPKVSVAGLLSFTLPKLSIRFTAVEGRSFAVLEGLPEPFPFEKVPPSPLPPAWLRRVGRYRSTGDESIVFHEVLVEVSDGLLVARQRVSSPLWGLGKSDTSVALLPISDDEAIVAGAGNGEGGVVRAVERDGDEVLISSGFTFRREKP